MVKFQKTAALAFLKKVNLDGAIPEFIVEEDGSVAAGLGTVLMVFGKDANFPGFGKKVGITNPAQLTKFINAIESADNMITASFGGHDLVLAARNTKYAYRSADPSTVVSMAAHEEKAKAKMPAFPVKVDITIDQATAIRKAISLLCKTAEDSVDRVELFASQGLLQAIVRDDATQSSSSIDVASGVTAEFKTVFLAKYVAPLLAAVGSSGATMYLAENSPMFLQLKDSEFVYLIGNVSDSQN